jgi:hypothetical protein
VSSKIGAELVLRAVLGVHVNPDDIPVQEIIRQFEAMYETIVAVSSAVPSRIHIDIEKD